MGVKEVVMFSWFSSSLVSSSKSRWCMDLRLYCGRYCQLPFGPPAQLIDMSPKLSPGPGSIPELFLSAFPSFLDKHA